MLAFHRLLSGIAILYIALSGLCSSLLYAEDAGEPLSSYVLDSSDNRYLTLENGLQVLCISQPTLTTSSVVMSIPKGYYSEPLEFPGLAKLHLKLLVTRSTKYTNDTGIARMLQSHKGEDLSTVTGTSTSIALSIDQAMYSGLIDRIVDTFNAPLFETKTTADKIKKMHSLWYKEQQHKGLFQDRVLGALIEQPGIANFHQGNLDTLKANDKLAKALINYHESTLLTPSMTIILASPKPIDELTTLAKKLDAITAKSAVNEEPIDMNTKGLAGQHVTIKHQDAQLSFLFPINKSGLAETRFDDLAKRILISDQQGSFTRWLDEKKYMNNISWQWVDWPGEEALTGFTIKLTDLGAKNTDEIIQLFNAYLAPLETLKDLEPYHKELVDVLTLDSFSYNPDLTLAYFQRIGLQSLDVPAAKWLTSSHALADFDAANAQTFFEQITGDNLITIESIKAKTDLPNKLPFSKLSYEAQPLTVKELKSAVSLKLPSTNHYIPSDFSIYSPGQYTKPTELYNKDQIQGHYLSGFTPNLPLGNLTLYFNQPDTIDNYDRFLEDFLLVDILKQRSIEVTEHANNAVNEMNISFEAGLKINLSGITQKQVLILDDLLAVIEKPVTQEEVNTSIKHLEAKFKEKQTLKSLDRAFFEFDKVKTNRLFTDETTTKRLASLTVEDINQAKANLFSSTPIKMFHYGNYDQAAIEKMAKKMEALRGEQATTPHYITEHQLVLEKGKTYQANVLHPDTDNAIYDLTIDHTDKNINKAAAIIFVMLIRGNENKRASLGVKDNKIDMSFREINNQPAIGLSVTGENDLPQMYKSLKQYKKEVAADFERLNEYSFESLKKDIVAQIDQTVASLNSDIDYHTTNWQHQIPEESDRIRVIEAIRDVKVADIKALQSRLFKDNQGSRILIQISGNKKNKKGSPFQQIKNAVILEKE